MKTIFNEIFDYWMKNAYLDWLVVNVVTKVKKRIRRLFTLILPLFVLAVYIVERSSWYFRVIAYAELYRYIISI